MHDKPGRHWHGVDIMSQDHAGAPGELIAKVRGWHGVSWHPSARSWLVTPYADAHKALRNPDLAEEALMQAWRKLRAKYHRDYPSVYDVFSHMPVAYEGPPHAELRKAVARVLAPVADRRADFRRRIATILERPRRDGAFDLATDFSNPLLFEVFCDLAEIPETDRPGLYPLSRFSKLIEPTTSIGVREQAETVVASVRAYLIGELKRQIARSSESLLVQSWRALQGREADPIEAAASLICVFFLMGNDAVSGTMSFGVHDLLADSGYGASHVPQAMWGTAGDDVFRHTATVDFVTRIATKATRVGDVDIEAGDNVMISPLAANHDPAEFGENANVIDPARGRGVGLTFGTGAHMCLGMRMARNVVDEGLKALSALPKIRMTGKMERTDGRVVRSAASLPVRLE